MIGPPGAANTRALGRASAPDKMRLRRAPPAPPSIEAPSRMRLSAYPIPNLKELPAEAEIVSHQLMLRAGLIRRLAAGLYSWLPIGSQL